MAKRRALVPKKPPGHELLPYFADLEGGTYRAVLSVTRVRRKKGQEIVDFIFTAAKDVKIRRPRQAAVAGSVDYIPPRRRRLPSLSTAIARRLRRESS
jgi:hypothetical protein